MSFISFEETIFRLPSKRKVYSNPPCFKSKEYLLGLVTVMCILPPFFKKKNVSFVENFGTCAALFPLFITPVAYLSATIAPRLVSGAVVNLAPISTFHESG